MHRSVKRVFVITGGTSGIGRACALALGSGDVGLVLVGRSFKRGSQVIRLIRKSAPRALVRFFYADLSEQKDVFRLARTICQDFGHVDVLINNAGARFDTYDETADGSERTFATNHLGHFLLTNLLLEHLKRAPSARIITVTSQAHLATKENASWRCGKHEYDRRQAYAKSKLANILFAFELARRLRGTNVVSNAVDPGVAATRFALNNGLIAWAKHLISHALTGGLSSARRAADGIVYLATSPEIAGLSGCLFRNRRIVEGASAAWMSSLSTNLWKESADLTGLTPKREMAAALSSES